VPDLRADQSMDESDTNVVNLILVEEAGRRMRRSQSAVNGLHVDAVPEGAKRGTAARRGCRRRDLNPHALTGH
jgi:hypothetical protein